MKDKDRPTIIDVYEITGEFPKEIFKNAQNKDETEEDKYEYSLQHYFIANVDGQKFLMYSEELPERWRTTMNTLHGRIMDSDLAEVLSKTQKKHRCGLTMR